MNAPPISRTPLLAPVVALVATLAAGTPRVAAAGELGWSMTGRPVDRIAGGEEKGEARIFVLGGGEVLTFDGEGRRRRALRRVHRRHHAPRVVRCWARQTPTRCSAPPGSPMTTARRRPRTRWKTKGSATGGARRGPTTPGSCPRVPGGGNEPASGSRPPPASSAATSTGCRPAGLDGRDLLLVAASGGGLVTATEDLLFRRADRAHDHADDTDGAADDGDTFTVSAGLAERPRALALDAAGAALVADDDGVLLVGGDGTVERILDRPTDALAVCGGQAVALSDDGVYRWSPGVTPVRTGDRPPVRGVGCGPTPEHPLGRNRARRLDVVRRRPPGPNEPRRSAAESPARRPSAIGPGWRSTTGSPPST